MYGWDGDGPRARDRARRAPSTAFDAAVARASLEVARGGGRIAFATSAPGVAARRSTARSPTRPRAAGGDVFDAVESAPCRPRSGSARLRWVDHVAVVTDGAALLADDERRRRGRGVALHAGPARPRGRRPHASPASRSRGLEVVAFAGLDAVALAVAAWRGTAVRVVPLDERRPPAATRRCSSSLDDCSTEPGRPTRRRRDAVSGLAGRAPVAAATGPARPTLFCNTGRSGLRSPRGEAGENGRGEPVAQSFATARFLTVQEVADLMRVSTMTVYRIIKSGELPAVRVGRSFRVRDVDVDTYLGQRYTQAG